jgi:Fic family protein
MYIEQHRSDYYRAIQDVRGHEGDLTYFLIYIIQAFAAEMERLLQSLTKTALLPTAINPRQRKAIAYARKHRQALTTQLYMRLCHCSDEMARRDFNQLIETGALLARGQGRGRKYLLP